MMENSENYTPLTVQRIADHKAVLPYSMPCFNV